MKRMHAVRLFVVLAIAALVAALVGVLAPHAAAQQSSPLTVEITSTDATQLPTTVITANVYNAVGTPLTGLTLENFSLRGALADAGGTITSVQNVSADAIPFSVVLVIDTSSSMYGTPLQRAKEAARAFVDRLRENDQVALIAFSSDVSLLQDFTTDKASIGTAIDALTSGGRTALYDAADAAIAAAQHAPTQRRVVVFLSDGQEDRGSESATRFTSLQNARTTGIPVYTIGFGSVDQDYMARFADGSGAQFFLAPSIERLGEIYTTLANALRSQYIITLNTPLANDGTEYPYELVVTFGDLTGSAAGSLRAPIPVPVVRLPDAPTAPINEPVTLTAQILADDPIMGFSYQLGDAAPQTLDSEPFEILIDPNLLPPGEVTLTLSATDNNGDTGTASLPLMIAALPPTITIDPDPASLGEIAEPVTLHITSGGQTAVNGLDYLFDDGGNIGADPELAAGLDVSIDPRDFAPGTHTLTVRASNEGGQGTETSASFTVAALPPLVNVIGLFTDQQVETPTTFTVQVTGQSQGDTESITVEVVQGSNRTPLEPDSAAFNQYTLDPMQFAPGAVDLVVTAQMVSGQSTTVTIRPIIAALSPILHVDGLENGDTLTADQEVTVTFDSQTRITHLGVFVDDLALAQIVSEPFSFTLQVLAYTPGDHTLRLVADNASGQTGMLDVGFSISPDPAATATHEMQQAAASQTQAAVSALGTQGAVATGTAVEIAQRQTATHSAAEQTSAARTATMEAQNAAATQIILDANATRDARNAAATQSILNATSTALQIAVNTVQAQTATQAAIDAAATRTVVDATSTALQIAVNTVQAQTATQSAIAAAATQAAISATATAQAALDATSTSAAATAQRQSTIDAAQGAILARQATQAAATEAAAEILRMENARTATANNILAGTANARTATVQARTGGTATATATAAPATEEPTETATLAIAQVTVDATAAATSEPAATETVEVTPEATPEAPITAQPQTAPTITPTLTAIEISQQQPPLNPQSLPLVLVGLGILVILAVVVYLILTSRRPKNRR